MRPIYQVSQNYAESTMKIIFFREQSLQKNLYTIYIFPKCFNYKPYKKTPQYFVNPPISSFYSNRRIPSKSSFEANDILFFVAGFCETDMTQTDMTKQMITRTNRPRERFKKINIYRKLKIYITYYICEIYIFAYVK